MAMDNAGALDGIKVLDLSSVLMGPLAAQMLGDMGADVIKIEPPEGDVARTAGATQSSNMASLFLAANRNKRSIVLDLRRAEARSVLDRLVKGCDVVLHTVRSSGLERIGLSYAALAKHNPSLIYCHLKGFSDSGAYAGQPAFDDMIQALSGIAALQSVITGEPRFVPAFFADKICGVHAAHAICLALIHKHRSGRGQQIDISMFETMSAFNLIEHMGGHAFEPPIGPMGYTSVRSGIRRPQRTKDGHISLWPVTDAQWIRFFKLIGRPELADDCRFNSLAARASSPELVSELFDQVLPLRTTDEWIALCRPEDLPAAAVNTLEDLLVDRHLDSVNFWRMERHPTEGVLRTVASPISLSDSPPSIRRLAPRLGEHTREILKEFSFSDDEIDKLVAIGAARIGARNENSGATATRRAT